MILMTLKAKYRSRNFRISYQPIHPSGQIETRTVQASRFKGSTNNSGKKRSEKKLRPRRKVYGPF